MPKFAVCFSALAPVSVTLNIEAETEDAAYKAANEKIDADDFSEEVDFDPSNLNSKDWEYAFTEELDGSDFPIKETLSLALTACQKLFDTIVNTGGLTRYPNGETACVADPLWDDLARAALSARAALVAAGVEVVEYPIEERDEAGFPVNGPSNPNGIDQSKKKIGGPDADSN